MEPSALPALNRRAVEGSRRAVHALDVSRLDDPTPCAEWTVRQLLEHMIVQHHGFAGAAEGAHADAAAWRPVPLSADPVAEYDAAADHVVAAFTADGALDGEFYLGEIAGGVSVPARTGMSFHLLDYVAHTWDLAEAVGVDAAALLDDELIAAALEISALIPGGDARTGPGASFAPVVDPVEDTPLARFLAVTGRTPRWRDR
jgi:uncharacterized protein (TIGR03086 family)